MRAKTCIKGSNPFVSATLLRATRYAGSKRSNAKQGALRSAQREGGLHNSRNPLHLAAGRFAPRMRSECLPYVSALRLSAGKRAQQEPALRRRHNRSETAPGRAQFRQVTAHGAVQTVAPCNLCRLLRRATGSRIRALSEIRLRPRLCESTSVVGSLWARPSGATSNRPVRAHTTKNTSSRCEPSSTGSSG
jgi:hypothetical protein